jgi:hypothetical protein
MSSGSLAIAHGHISYAGHLGGSRAGTTTTKLYFGPATGTWVSGPAWYWRWWQLQRPNGRAGSFSGASVNLALLLPVVAVPTALLWWRHLHRIAPGHCRQCRYNLVGVTCTLCPECGAEKRA